MVSPVQASGPQEPDAAWRIAPKGSLLVSIAVLLGAQFVMGAGFVAVSADPNLRALYEAETTSELVLDTGEEFVVMVMGLAGMVALAAMVVSGILAMVWTWRVRGNAETLSESRHSLSRVWAWAGWITPVVSLWFPNQVIRDIDKADKGALSVHPGSAGPKPPINAWWACYLGYWIIGQVYGAIPGDGWDSTVTYRLSTPYGIVALILFRRVTQIIETDQATAHATVGDRLPEAPALNWARGGAGEGGPAVESNWNFVGGRGDIGLLGWFEYVDRRIRRPRETLSLTSRTYGPTARGPRDEVSPGRLPRRSPKSACGPNSGVHRPE